MPFELPEDTVIEVTHRETLDFRVTLGELIENYITKMDQEVALQKMFGVSTLEQVKEYTNQLHYMQSTYTKLFALLGVDPASAYKLKSVQDAVEKLLQVEQQYLILTNALQTCLEITGGHKDED